MYSAFCHRFTAIDLLLPSLLSLGGGVKSLFGPVILGNCLDYRLTQINIFLEPIQSLLISLLSPHLTPGPIAVHLLLRAGALVVFALEQKKIVFLTSVCLNSLFLCLK